MEFDLRHMKANNCIFWVIKQYQTPFSGMYDAQRKKQDIRISTESVVTKNVYPEEWCLLGCYAVWLL
jgi:hypothetical protein